MPQHYKFTIIDYTTNTAGDSTVIDEPVGWDALSMKLSRHKEWHGFFDYFDASLSMLEFDNVGFGILKDGYELIGVDARVELLIEFACSDTDAFEEIYLGNFDFATYEQICSNRCYIKINVETTSCLVKLKNRYDQKVDLESLRTFDLPDGDADDLAAYAGLGFEMTLDPAKVFLRTFYQITNPSIFNFVDGGLRLVGEIFFHYYTFYLDRQIENSLPTFGAITNNTDVNSSVSGGPLAYFIANGFPYFELTQLSKLICYGEFDINIHVKGQFTEDTNSDRQYSSSFFLRRVEPDGTETDLDTQVIAGLGFYNGNVPNTDGFDLTFTVTTALNEGDKLFFALALGNYQYLSGGGGVGDPFTLEVEFEIFDFDISGLTNCEPTNSKVFLINETLSRTAEIVTDDCLRVYSDYFGRTDAEPYTSADDGCGGLETVTNGLNIRRAVNTDGSEPKFNISMKDLFESLTAIHNIGMGVEPDPNRAGFEMLRIEKFQHFYSDTVILTLDKIAKVTREVNRESLFSVFKSGYQKFETETAGGLNDIHTHRNFRTTLQSISKTLEKVCRFIASGHSIEVTRWQVGATSEDWRYDTDTFIISVKRDGTYLNDYRAQRGEDMPTADNLPGWQTCYNVLISPQRNARRWVPIVFQCYADYVNGIMKFMDGDGNLIASTYIDTEQADCITQSDNVPFTNIPENSDISLSPTAPNPFDASNVESFYPIFRPERDVFEYVISYEQWKLIKANPTGLIGYQCGNGPMLYGWIDDLNYTPAESSGDHNAEFVLIPQIKEE